MQIHIKIISLQKINILGKNILICPLNWGLGHATRCVPIIRGLSELGHNPIIAADKGPLAFLQKEFPDVEMIKLPGFDPVYSKGNSQVFKMLTSVPTALLNFRKEHLSLDSIIRDHNIDAIISDNRFGCWSKKIHSVFMTHQLHIQTPYPWKWAYPIVNGLCRSYLNNYDELWIPDIETEPSLSGILAHPDDAKIKTTYIGLLSRFQNECQENEKDIDYLVILSGPEPQRSILENMIIKQADTIDGRIVILRAKPNVAEMPTNNIPENVTLFNHVEDDFFVDLVEKSENIICRGGYSSLMDLIHLNRNAYLVPTPGQTEQEYLADYLKDKNLFNSCRQKDFRLNKVSIPKTDLKNYFNNNTMILNDILKNWLDRI